MPRRCPQGHDLEVEDLFCAKCGALVPEVKSDTSTVSGALRRNDTESASQPAADGADTGGSSAEPPDKVRFLPPEARADSGVPVPAETGEVQYLALADVSRFSIAVAMLLLAVVFVWVQLGTRNSDDQSDLYKEGYSRGYGVAALGDVDQACDTSDLTVRDGSQPTKAEEDDWKNGCEDGFNGG